ncbi:MULTISPECIES: VWA domain-containing protein [unclassified Breznakia]|uniref:VWA domain-containing protein n=2 Tax=unclassified Breznakia TaxID=2623764 RepID=UPI0024739D6E|nr:MULTISPECIES: VWA domain-containing protein [unclassified Breznakia]MDH6414983.1 putative repeat protein (TIGR01451 family) [Breznakia sp. PFB1-14]MDH6419656.1 putative repeat protein (TIGR01451 family) [Breznakia sp. PFB1-12]
MKLENNKKSNWKLDLKSQKLRLFLMVFFLVSLGFSMIQIEHKFQTPNHYIETRRLDNQTSQVSHVSTYDYQNPIAIGSDVDYKRSINRGLSRLDEGEAIAKKYAVIASEEDGKNGIIKSIYDVVGKPVTYQQDVLFVLDSSSSMNMYAQQAYAAQTIHCLHDEHYYKIAAHTFINTTDKDIYFQPSTSFGLLKWSNISQDQWKHFMNEYKLKEVEVSKQMIEAWNPVAHHYKKEKGKYVHIKTDQKLLEEHTFASPKNHVDGCTDRLSIAKSSIQSLTRSMLKASEGNQIGFISFSGTHTDYTAFTSEYANIIEGIHNTKSDVEGNTDALFSYVEKIVSERKQERVDVPLKIILISDGASTHDKSSLPIINRIKMLDDVEIFATGIHVENDIVLRAFATDETHFMNAISENHFIEYFKNLTTKLVTRPEVNLTFTLAEAFTIYCDTTHPITIGEKEYTSIDQVPSSLLEISKDAKDYQWNIGAIGLDGRRLSFYTKMDEDIRYATTGTHNYSTTDTAQLNYQELLASVDGIASGNQIMMPLYQLQEVSVLNSQIETKKRIKKTDGNTITYQIDVYNNGSMDLHNIVLVEFLEDNITHIKDEKNTSKKRYVNFKIDELAAGKHAIITYEAIVDKDTLDNSTQANIEIRNYEAYSKASRAKDVLMSQEYLYREHSSNTYMAEFCGFITVALGLLLLRLRKIRKQANTTKSN